MIKKEVLEIRKQLSPQNCAISRICGCYVDNEKEKRLEFKEAFLSLPEEEAFKYFDIFTHTLSGTIGKNMLNMEFPLEQELKGGTQEFLLQLRNTKLTDDELLSKFYDKVIETYDFNEHYLILLIHAAYDVPGRASDGSEMFDASDSVYDFILCSICPVNLSKPGLCYNAQKNTIEDRIRDWIINNPANGFLFPAFNDRASDLHSLLYYSKDPEKIQYHFIGEVLGCTEVMTAGSQKDAFNIVLTESLKEACNYDVVKSIHENLNGMIEEHKEIPEPLVLGKKDVKNLIVSSGVSEDYLETFEDDYDHVIGERKTLLATNIAETRKFKVKTPEIVINVDPERTDLIEIQEINGQKCLVIPIENEVEVNGITVTS